MPAPDFVVVGHVTRDISPGGWRMGGTVTFAAAQAHALGLSVGVLTRATPDVDAQREVPYAELVQLGDATATAFENVYDAGHRQQHVRAIAGPIAAADLPDAWRAAPVVLLGPVFAELDPAFGAEFSARSVIGVSAQGWLRGSDDAGRVVHTPWTGDPFWRGADVLFVSDEDLADGGAMLETWCAEVPTVAMTEGWRGLRLHAGGGWRRMDAFPADEVDPTGAGDTFATAFLIRLHETGDVDEAARFGAAAASIAIAGIAAETIPTRAQVEARLRAHPEVALR